MNTDLAELTQGKRAATYPEVDEYLGHALIAEGVAPQGFTAEEATRWWRTGGYRALAASPKGQPSLDGPELRAASVPSPEDGAMTNDSAPMEVPEGDSEGSERGAVSPGVSTAGISQSPAQSSTMSTGRPTTFEDVLRGVDAWSPRGAAPDKAPVEHRPRPEQAKNQPPKPARPPSAKVAPATAPGISGTRMWPVAGNGAYAIGNSREKGPNHKFYSDGNYDPKGTGLRGKSHFGLDEKSKLGAPVYAAASGTLYMIGTQTITRKDKKKRPVLDKHNRPIRVPAGYGNFIAILHPDGYVTIYGHLPPPSKYMRSLKPGDPIAIGTQIATVGNTGNAGAKGDHLHFEVRVSNGTRTMGYASSGGNHTVDPRLWMKGALPNVPIIPSNVDPLAHPKPRILAARKR
jgi:murein DD-endopeptidase MepM/ murein hydrolase activator NlpD